MSRVIVCEILVGFVADVIEAISPAKLIYSAKCRLSVNGTGRIIRRNRDDRSRPVGDRPFDEFRLELRIDVGWGEHRARIRHGDRHLVIELVRGLEDHFVFGIDDREERIDEAHIAACSDHDPTSISRVYRILDG